jgi:hypothetical protein
MPALASDRNLLLGVLAVQMDFVTQSQLVAAMNAWVLNKRKSLGRILVESGVIRPDVRNRPTITTPRFRGVGMKSAWVCEQGMG